MTYAQAKELLKKQGQEQLLRFWPRLTAAERKALLAQIATIDFREVARCQTLLPGAANAAAGVAKKGAPTAPKVAQLKGAALKKAREAGEAELRAGRVGVLLVAGFCCVGVCGFCPFCPFTRLSMSLLCVTVTFPPPLLVFCRLSRNVCA